MSSNVENKLWVEKYRPKSVDDMIMESEYKKIFEKWIDEKEIPNTLFVGKPGSGKTTLARILIDKIIDQKSADLIYLNGSSERGIAVVRELIEDFLKSPVYGSNSVKIVFIDEFDFMTQEAQGALRNIIETNSTTGRFILTANYESKITPAIQSRMQIFKFKELPKDYILNYIKNILNSEKITIDKECEEHLVKLINSLHPDVRKILNTVQMNSVDGKLILKSKEVNSAELLCRSYINDLISATKDGKSEKQYKSISNINNIVKENDDIDYLSLYEQLCDDDNIPPWAQIIIEKYASTQIDSMIPRFHLKAMLFSIIEAGRNYRIMMSGK